MCKTSEHVAIRGVYEYMKRILSTIAVVGVIVIVAEIIFSGYSGPTPIPSQVNGTKILAAAQSYARDLQAHGQVVPATVSLHNLMAKGLLKPEDASGFSGMDVSVSLTTKATGPQDVLMWVRMQDGSQIVALTDGSVHIARPKAVGSTNDLGLASGTVELSDNTVKINAISP